MIKHSDFQAKMEIARLYPLGVHLAPVKAKGGVGRFTPHSGKTRGIKTDRMKTFYRPGCSPKEKMVALNIPIYTMVFFKFKGKETFGILHKMNDSTFTVDVIGHEKKKAIRYDKFVSTTSEIFIPKIVPPPVKTMKSDVEKAVGILGTVSFKFKGVETIGVLQKFNDKTFTVKIAGEKNLKSILYNNFIQAV